MNSTLRVRCYCHGFGDCFLLTFAGEEKSHMLIDCGVGRATPDRETRLDEVRADILKATNGRLAVLVVTHEHYDHLSGFFKKEFWKSLNVEQVWMPWCDDPSDKTAQEFEERKRKALAVLPKLALRAGGTLGQNLKLLLELNGWETSTMAAKQGELFSLNENMRELREFVAGLVDAPRYLKPGTQDLQIPGTMAHVQVLGPSLRLDDLKAKHLKLTSIGLDTEDEAASPVLKKGSGDERLSQRELFWGYEVPDPVDSGQKPVNTHDVYYQEGSEWRRLEHMHADLEELALQATGYINNTSLVLLIRHQEKLLLFPGDAEKESWQTWHEALQVYSGDSPKTLEDLFRRIHFYKAAHHGSVNGTVWSGAADYLDSRCLSFTPVEKYSNWQIPSSTFLQKMESLPGSVLGSDPLKALRGADPSQPIQRDFGTISMGETSPATGRPLFVDFLFD